MRILARKNRINSIKDALPNLMFASMFLFFVLGMVSEVFGRAGVWFLCAAGLCWVVLLVLSLASLAMYYWRGGQERKHG